MSEFLGHLKCVGLNCYTGQEESCFKFNGEAKVINDYAFCGNGQNYANSN